MKLVPATKLCVKEICVQSANVRLKRLHHGLSPRCIDVRYNAPLQSGNALAVIAALLMRLPRYSEVVCAITRPCKAAMHRLFLPRCF